MDPESYENSDNLLTISRAALNQLPEVGALEDWLMRLERAVQQISPPLQDSLRASLEKSKSLLGELRKATSCPTASQLAGHKSPARWRYLRIGKNGGKTTWVAWEVARALQGNNPYRHHLPRRNIHIALASTNMAQVIEILLPRIQAFFDGTDFTLIPESIQRRVWRCPQTNNRIKAFAFSQAVQAMRGYGLHMLVLDEVEPTDPTNIWEELYARLVKVDGDLLISATPENALWVRDKVENNVHLNLAVIRGSTVENIHNLPNPEAVQAWMDGMSEAQYKMYIEGEIGRA